MVTISSTQPLHHAPANGASAQARPWRCRGARLYVVLRCYSGCLLMFSSGWPSPRVQRLCANCEARGCFCLSWGASTAERRTSASSLPRRLSDEMASVSISGRSTPPGDVDATPRRRLLSALRMDAEITPREFSLGPLTSRDRTHHASHPYPGHSRPRMRQLIIYLAVVCTGRTHGR